jgi:hypothetical protein
VATFTGAVIAHPSDPAPAYANPDRSTIALGQ